MADSHVHQSKRPVPWPDGDKPWPMIETAVVWFVKHSTECGHCNRRPAVVAVSDGVMVGEERYICAPCLLDAVQAYPEHDE